MRKFIMLTTAVCVLFLTLLYYKNPPPLPSPPLPPSTSPKPKLVDLVFLRKKGYSENFSGKMTSCRFPSFASQELLSPFTARVNLVYSFVVLF